MSEQTGLDPEARRTRLIPLNTSERVSGIRFPVSRERVEASDIFPIKDVFTGVSQPTAEGLESILQTFQAICVRSGLQWKRIVSDAKSYDREGPARMCEAACYYIIPLLAVSLKRWSELPPDILPRAVRDLNQLLPGTLDNPIFPILWRPRYPSPRNEVIALLRIAFTLGMDQTWKPYVDLYLAKFPRMFDLWRRAAGLDPTTALTTLVPALTFIRCLAVGGKSILEFDRAMLAVGLYWDAEASTYRPISTTTDQSALPPADTHFRAISPNDAQPQISEDLCSSVRRILRDMERMQELIKYLYLGKTISGLSREEVADMPRQLQQLSERCNFTIPSSRVLDQPAAEEMITQLEQRCTSLMQTIESAEQLDLQPGTEVWVSRNRPDGGQYPEWGWQFQEITPEGRVRVTCEQNGVAKSKIIPLTDLTAQTAEPTT